jgi:hypothetical protein
LEVIHYPRDSGPLDISDANSLASNRTANSRPERFLNGRGQESKVERRHH